MRLGMASLKRGNSIRAGTVAGTVLLSCMGATARLPAAQPSSLLTEAIAWYTGTAGRVDDARAHALLLEAVKLDDPLARMWLARCHSRGRMGFVADQPKARALAQPEIATIDKMARAGVLEAVFLMATAYDEGLGRAEDPALAAEWLRRAAASGHTLAQHNLGNAYAAGRGVERNDRLAVEWWLKAAAAGDAIPQLRLGEAYEAGRGVTRDLAAARHWYGEAARRGNAAAQQALQRLLNIPPPSSGEGRTVRHVHGRRTFGAGGIAARQQRNQRVALG